MREFAPLESDSDGSEYESGFDDLGEYRASDASDAGAHLGEYRASDASDAGAHLGEYRASDASDASDASGEAHDSEESGGASDATGGGARGEDLAESEDDYYTAESGGEEELEGLVVEYADDVDVDLVVEDDSADEEDGIFADDEEDELGNSEDDHKHDSPHSSGASVGAPAPPPPSERALRLLVIGDTHFKHRQVREGEEFAAAAVAAAERLAPDAIVCLGDTLDTHEIVHVQAHKLACDFLHRLAEVAHVYLLIGNHDLINHKQFLTENHVFTPLKLWPSVTVVDKPHIAELGDYTFVMCPYVPNGRFVDALDTLLSPSSPFHWQVDADCIFAHQEFRGCSLGGAETSDAGDRWAPEYPPVISGHIHEAHDLGDNIFYTGSVLQHSFGETKPKRLWLVTFDRDAYGATRAGYDPFRREYVDLGLKRKQVYELQLAEFAERYRPEWAARAHVKLKLTGTAAQIRTFRRSPRYAELLRQGVKVAFVPERDAADELAEFAARGDSAPKARYHAILAQLIAHTPEPLRAQTQSAYEALADEDRQVEEAAPTALVFQEA